MDVDKALVIIRGKKVLEVDKYDYSKHPEAKKLRSSKAAAHVPDWQRTQARHSATHLCPQSPAGSVNKNSNVSPTDLTPASSDFSKPHRSSLPTQKPKIIATSKESILSKPKIKKEE